MITEPLTMKEMRYKYKFDFHIFAFPPINLINLSINHKTPPYHHCEGDGNMVIHIVALRHVILIVRYVSSHMFSDIQNVNWWAYKSPLSRG